MKRPPILISAILSLFAVTFLSGMASAAQVQVVSMVGSWRNPSYSGSCTNGGSGAQCSISNGDPTSSINWGGTVAQSGYDFSKSIPGTITLPSSSTFPMGTFTHRNQNLSVNPAQVSLRNVALDVVVTLNVDGTPVGPLTFAYTFTHDETNNTSNISQCDPNKMNPGSTVPCPDVVTLTGSAAPTSFVVGGVNYTLTMSFVTGQNPQPLNKFITEENQTNVASLVGQFTVAQTPTVTFTANPTSISSGQSSVLTWTTQNATQVTINQGIGSVSLNGNTTVSPSTTTTYTLTATGPGGSTNATATVSVVQSGSARFDFSPTTYQVNEDASVATITVTRSVNTTGTASVQFAATNGTASANQDYLSVLGTLTFANGETTKTFDVPLIDDAIVESNETVNLSLSSPVNGTIGASQATLTILDNDSTNPPPPAPAPLLTELIPYTVTVNFNQNFEMRVIGLRFDPAAQVIWNNSTPLPIVRRTGSTEIVASMSPALWNNTVGSYPVLVRNPGPQDSDTLPFIVRPISGGNPPPWIVSQPTANPNPVNGGTTTSLSTLGGTFSNNGSESVLTYTWMTTGPAPVTFSANGTNSAKNATATFARIGTYTFQVRVRDTVTNFAVDSDVLSVVVNAGVGSVVVTPKAITLNPGDPFNFTASVRDQFGAPFTSPVTWSATGGAIGNTGSFTAPPTGNTINVTASSGNKSDSATVTLMIIGVGAGDLSNVKVGPVPFKSNSGDPGVTFRNLPPGTSIRIFTAYGRIVSSYKLDNGGDHLWDLTNANFDKVASGVYFYTIESGGNKKEGKLVIIK